MLVGVSFLAISLSVLIYYHPPSSWNVWPFAIQTPRKSTSSDSPSSGLQMNEAKQRTPATDAVAPRQDLQTQNDSTIEDSVRADSDSALSPQTTPKALPLVTGSVASIPSFSLESHSSEDEDEPTGPPPSFPAMNSAQRTSVKPSFMGPPLLPKPNGTGPTPAPSQLMPPPPRIVPTNLRALPTPSRSMHVPTTGPLPNRGRPVSNGLGPPQAAPIKTPNARGKVLLSPGHSPLDWANLQKSGTNLSGVQSLIRVTPTQLKYNNGRKGRPAWSSYQGKVYNITPYLPYHPGGEGELRRAAGKDGGKLFMEVHPWVNWENMLGECIVGIMVGEAEERASQKSSLEDMD